MVTPLKRCTGCGNEYPLTSDYFHKDGTKADGFHPKCKSCRKGLARQYFLNNSEEILRKGAEWKRDNPGKISAQTKAWAKNHLERRKETKKRFLEKNPGKYAEYTKRWRDGRREQYREYDRAYRSQNRERQRQTAQKAREQNRDRYRSYARNRYAAQRGNGGTHTAEDVRRQYERQNGLCFWCSQETGQRYHVDHIIPVTRGGSNSPENLVITCPPCNQSKSDKLPYDEWRPPKPLWQ